jgi:hypothetical protein
MKHVIVGSALALAGWLPAGQLLAAPTEASDIGKTTRSVLQMQRAGRQSVETRPMLKDVADRTYERYLESFTYPVPERFDRESSFSPAD